MRVAVDLREKNQLTLPRAVADALSVRAGDKLSFELQADGTVTVRGLVSVPADQAWFWAPEWQAGEARASADLALQHTETFNDDDDADAWLASL